VKNPPLLNTLSQWNSIGIWGYYNQLKPYLSYTITVRSTRLNTPKLSDYQVSLYQKICDLRFDDNLTWKQVADSLNELGYTSTRGKQNTSSTVCSTYFKIRKHFERKHKYIPPDLDDVELIWE
tara:strand:- start:110 stop:478 length:369 start_codon:yes stop_codon:yes gene_type:complete